jgi:hypothetical protein
MTTEFIKRTDNFISESKIDELIRDSGPIFLKDITTLAEAIKFMHIHKYNSICFDFNKTLKLPALSTEGIYGSTSGLLIFDRDLKKYIYNYDELFSTYIDLITDIKSSCASVKLKYNENISDITTDFKLYNFLSQFQRKSLNFYFTSQPTENEELHFSMRCYILTDDLKSKLKRKICSTTTHTYSGGL